MRLHKRRYAFAIISMQPISFLLTKHGRSAVLVQFTTPKTKGRRGSGRTAKSLSRYMGCGLHQPQKGGFPANQDLCCTPRMEEPRGRNSSLALPTISLTSPFLTTNGGSLLATSAQLSTRLMEEKLGKS